MSKQYILRYLNDHLAGSVSAVELLQHLESQHAGTEIARLASWVRDEIKGEQGVLRELIHRCDGSTSLFRRATAWLAEKAAELKFTLDDPSGSKLHLLEAWEALSLGIEGKRGLWMVLAAAADGNSVLQGPDYDQLINQAEQQRMRVEQARRAAAAVVLNDAVTTSVN